MLTPKGLEVLVLVLRISLRRSSGVGCVRAVSCMGKVDGLAGWKRMARECVYVRGFRLQCLGRLRWRRQMRVQRSRPIAYRLGRQALAIISAIILR
jgi:hypothetical protein